MMPGKDGRPVLTPTSWISTGSSTATSISKSSPSGGDASNRTNATTHPDPAVVQTTKWQHWVIPFNDFAGVNLAGVRKMSIGVSDPDNPAAGGTGVIYIDDIGFGHPLSSQ